jgi:hypothetical protein
MSEAQGHGLHVEFYIDAKEMPFKSEEAGRPIYEDVEFIKIMIPGDKNFSPEREAHAGDRTRFPLEYARFKIGMKEEEQAVGTPLKHWPAMSRSMVKNFGAFNVHTVEQLAGMSDTGKQAFGMGAQEWSVKAKAYLEVSGNTAEAQKYATENENLKRDIADLRGQFEALSAQVEADKKATAGRTRKPGNAVSEITEAL